METLTAALFEMRVGDEVMVEVHREIPSTNTDNKAEFEIFEIKIIIGDSHNY